MEKLAKSLTKIFVNDGNYSTYRGQRHGRPVENLSPHQFLGYIQNHDQVGNRAIGDRLEQIVGMDRAKVAAGIVLMSPFLPMIFQGEEFAASTPFQYFADHDPEMAKAVLAGRKGEFAAFGWNPDEIPDPGKMETFQRSKLNWDEVREGRHAEMLDWYRKLIRLREASPSLNDGEPGQTKVSFDEEKRWLVMERGQVTVMCNLGTEQVELENARRCPLLLASRADVKVAGDRVALPPDTLAILSGEKNQQVV
jgi:maltooligosyltrehalose trehalohydrolase